MNKNGSGNNGESGGAVKVERGLALLCFLTCLVFSVMTLTKANFYKLLIILL